MRTSDLIHRITIQKLISTTNENGFPDEYWTDFKTVWASKNNLSGREYWGAMAVQQETTVEFGLRYAPFIEEMDSKAYRLVHNSKTYNITFIDNFEYKKVFVKIKSLEVI